MAYISTRSNEQAPLSFEDVLLTGLAPDGGLYVPESLPHYTADDLKKMAQMDYQTLAFEIMYPFVSDSINAPDFKTIIAKSYQQFRHQAIAPLVEVEKNMWVLELFHGPTLAFKDVALQFLGHMFDHVLSKRNQRVVVLGATSGDTGSAAIDGCSVSSHIDIVILHPHNRVSDVQRKQMTSHIAPNVHNIAIKGNFDDCQNLVKQSFRNQSFLPKGRQLVAINSINWARIMAQIVYYFYAALRLDAPNRSVSFSVPTGNFGNILAGYFAKRMGLPIEQLIIATNANDILHRFISHNQYERQTLQHTLSPSMDIMISSNFERLLFDLYDRNPAAITTLMQDFEQGKMPISDAVWQKARAEFQSYATDDATTCSVMKQLYEQSDGYIADPHTATAINAAWHCRNPQSNAPMVVMATAHPVKFGEAVIKAGLPEPSLPPHMADLFDRKEKYDILDNDLSSLHRLIAEKLS